MDIEQLKIKTPDNYNWDDIIYINDFDEDSLEIIKRESKIGVNIYYIKYSTLRPFYFVINNLLDFKPEKLSIKTENDELSTIITHQVRYENGGFYLTIDNIKGYFRFGNNNNMVLLNMIFSNDDQKNKYHQVWKEIFKIVDNGNGELKLHEKIVLPDSDMPTDKMIKIPSVTIVIKSLIEEDNKFYLELSLNHLSYKL